MSPQRLVILDFEATCDRHTPPEPQEIIEFPSVLVDLCSGAVQSEFSTFVRPTIHPRLTPFCTELTSIEQDDVEGAPPFIEVIEQHQAWLEEHGLLGGDAVLVTCGDWDLNVMLPAQCAASGPPITDLPAFYREWVNIKSVFAGLRTRRKGAPGMVGMLRDLGLPLIGTHHRGIDDCRNIARIALSLKALGARFEVTGRFSPSRYPPLSIAVQWGETQASLVLQKRSMASLLGLASEAFGKQIRTLTTREGVEVDNELLLTLRSGVTLIAT